MDGAVLGGLSGLGSGGRDIAVLWWVRRGGVKAHSRGAQLEDKMMTHVAKVFFPLNKWSRTGVKGAGMALQPLPNSPNATSLTTG